MSKRKMISKAAQDFPQHVIAKVDTLTGCPEKIDFELIM